MTETCGLRNRPYESVGTSNRRAGNEARRTRREKREVKMIATAFLHGLAAVALLAAPAAAQTDADLAQEQRKHALARMIPLDMEPSVRRLVPPSEQTLRREYFGYRLLLGARYEPSIHDDEDWITVACQSVDPRQPWEDDVHGSSALVRVHALIYELERDGSLDTDGRISTAETEALDEGICDLSRGIDTTFIDIPRNFDAAIISLYSVAGRRQYAEVVENVERTLSYGRVEED